MYGMAGIVEGNGHMLMLVGMTVVFFALVVLLFSMKALKRIYSAIHKRRQSKENVSVPAASTATGDALDNEDMPAVVAAAIALTLILEEAQVHDEESMVLTLRNLPKPYSNWWQSRMDSAWNVKRCGQNVAALQKVDPERGAAI